MRIYKADLIMRFCFVWNESMPSLKVHSILKWRSCKRFVLIYWVLPTYGPRSVQVGVRGRGNDRIHLQRAGVNSGSLEKWLLLLETGGTGRVSCSPSPQSGVNENGGLRRTKGAVSLQYGHARPNVDTCIIFASFLHHGFSQYHLASE